MARLKTKDIQKMNKEDKMKKIDELKIELMKARVSAAKAGTSKIKEIKRTIAKILTLDHQEGTTSKKGENHK